jgi:hypothetical protein
MLYHVHSDAYAYFGPAGVWYTMSEDKKRRKSLLIVCKLWWKEKRQQLGSHRTSLLYSVFRI